MNELIKQLQKVDRGYTDSLEALKQSYNIQLDKYEKAYAELNQLITQNSQGLADDSLINKKQDEIIKLDILVREYGQEIQLVTEYRNAEIDSHLKQIEAHTVDYIDGMANSNKTNNHLLQKARNDYLNMIFTNHKTRKEVQEFESTLSHYHAELGKPYTDTSLKRFDIEVNSMIDNSYEITPRDIQNYIVARTPIQ